MQVFSRPIVRLRTNRWLALVILAGMSAVVILFLWMLMPGGGQDKLSLPPATRPLILFPIPRDG